MERVWRCSGLPCSNTIRHNRCNQKCGGFHDYSSPACSIPLVTDCCQLKGLFLTSGESLMSLTSVSGTSYGSGINARSTFVPTKTATTVQTPATNGTIGRGGDTYQCVSCGGRKIVSSLYCPTCQGGSSARTSTPYANPHGSCPTCGKTDSTRSAAAYAGSYFFHNAAGR